MKADEHIWRSRPRRTKPRILEKTFVGDNALVDRLVTQVATSADTPNKHYGVIVGRAGVGKSHVLALTVARARKTVPAEQLVVAWMPDDPSGLASPLHLYEAILRELGEHGELEEVIAEDRDAAAARARVVAAVEDRTLLLCIDGLDQVLAAFGEEGQRELRSFLQQERCCAVLATARALTADFTDQGRPFFGFFGVHRVDGIDAKAVTKLLAALARARGDAELATAVRGKPHEPTFAALHHMLGGLPARYIDLLRDLRDLEQPERMLLRALDEHAQGERAAREQLSPQQRLILHWLSQQRGAVPVKAVARGCAISEQTVSPQLRSLRRSGWVTSTKLGRESWCEVHDPLTGIDVDYALALFRFLVSWHVDAEAACAGGHEVAARLRDVSAEDSRSRLGLPRLERRLVSADRSPV